MKKPAVLTDLVAIPASGRGKKSVPRLCALIAAICAMPLLAYAQALTTQTFTLPFGGSGSSTSDMIYDGTGPDGISWSGGAVGVQGSLATHEGQPESGFNPSVTAANVAFTFNVGTAVDSLNATYGAGNWTIANATLTFESSGAVVENTRFGLGGGTYSIFWVANDTWIQTEDTSDNTNPPYASSAAALYSWAGSLALLDSATYSIQGQTGPFSVSNSLAADPNFVNRILSASATGDPNVSLYLMGTSDALGMLIFTGGEVHNGAQNREPHPTLSFDVVTAAAPAAVPALGPWGFLAAACGLLWLATRRREKS
jgi:hypothetical protein